MQVHRTLLKLALSLICGLVLQSCSAVNLGDTRNHVTYVANTDTRSRNLEIFTCSDNLKVDCQIIDVADGGKTFRVSKINLKGKALIRPDVAIAKGLIAPRIMYQITVNGLGEGEEERSTLQAGGWYVMQDNEPKAEILKEP